jgi:hypothetical protein
LIWISRRGDAPAEQPAMASAASSAATPQPKGDFTHLSYALVDGFEGA